MLQMKDIKPPNQLNFNLTWNNEYLNLTGYQLHRSKVQQYIYNKNYENHEGR